MNRRDFIKAASALAVSMVLPATVKSTLVQVPDVPSTWPHLMNPRDAARRALAEWYEVQTSDRVTWFLMHFDENGIGYVFEERYYDEETRTTRISEGCSSILT